jgi:DNA-binding response OmpR family regulator
LHASDDAYDEIKAATPNLVTLDMTLEHPDAGWLVLQLLKLDPATVGTPVIICSADVALLRERYDKIRALGCYIVEKPFDLDILLDTVRQALVSR